MPARKFRLLVFVCGVNQKFPKAQVSVYQCKSVLGGTNDMVNIDRAFLYGPTKPGRIDSTPWTQAIYAKMNL